MSKSKMAPRDERVLGELHRLDRRGLLPVARQVLTDAVGHEVANALSALRRFGLVDYPTHGLVDLTGTGRTALKANHTAQEGE